VASAGYTAASSGLAHLSPKSPWSEEKAFSNGPLQKHFATALLLSFRRFSAMLKPFRFSYKNLCGQAFFRKIYRNGAP